MSRCVVCSRIFDVSPRARGLVCSRSCQNEYLRVKHRGAPPARRFWAKVNKDGPVPQHVPQLGPCWIWTGSLESTGYGQMASGEGRKLVRTHRFSYTLNVGPIPEGQHVLHKCDVRHCVNPSHLFIGDASANMQDAKSKGRLVPAPSGVQHNRARLNPDLVREIRALAAGGHSVEGLARRFGVWPNAIDMVVKRRSWKSVA